MIMGLIRNHSIAMFVVVCTVLLVAPSAVAEDYAIPEHGNYQLAVPRGWKVSSRESKQPPSVTLEVEPEIGDAFNMQVTTVLLDKGALAKTSPQSIREDVQRSGRQSLPQAAENTVTIQELRGVQTVGYYYTLTDRSPKPGEFKFMIQGITLHGQAMTTFTILYRAPNTAEVDQALKILAAATYVAK